MNKGRKGIGEYSWEQESRELKPLEALLAARFFQAWSASRAQEREQLVERYCEDYPKREGLFRDLARELEKDTSTAKSKGGAKPPSDCASG